MTSMSKSLTRLLIALIIIAGLTYVAFFGITAFNKQFSGVLSENSGIKQGLDLRGGSVITYEADANSVSDAEMDTVISMLRTRLDNLGYTEATITKQGTKRVRIEIPDISDPEEAVQKIGATAKLTFVDKDDEIVLDGTDVKDATQQYGATKQSGASENYVSLELTSEGQKKFAEATSKISGYANGENYIAIKLDEDVISSPRVSETIDSDTCIITGSFDAESAAYLAEIIRAGQLPFSLKDVELRSVGPTLGEKALSTSLWAGLIGILLVMLFMLLLYRIPGLIADIALCAYITIVALTLAITGANLTLPGIAGIILGIGMAVDANVIIFERIKDELAHGKTVGAAIDSGFHRAITAVLDANVTTLIAAVVLWYFGTGPIKGFAITLGIGIIASMITAVLVTRFLLRQLVGLNIRNPKLYGASLRGGKA